MQLFPFVVARKMWKRAIYSFLGFISDVLDTLFSALSFNRRPSRDFLPSDIDGLSDDEILKLTRGAPRLRSGYSTFQITPNTVGKPSQDNEDECLDAIEANALNLVFSKTTIPVPRVRRIVKKKWNHLIVMDYVNGQLLAEAWPAFSLWRKITVAFTLRRYVRQLRRLKPSSMTPPGPLSAHGPRKCESPIFGQLHSDRGPFTSYMELSDFFNERRKMSLDDFPGHRTSRIDQYDDSSPLVFTHQDLNPRNIIVGEDGRIWIIDWAWAGYYPQWFEYVAMLRQAANERVIGSNRMVQVSAP